MSLVVARQIRDAIAIAADWRITGVFARPSYLTGGLKVIAIHPYVVCAYVADDVDFALAAIQEFRGLDPSARVEEFFDRLVGTLADASAAGECDFVVARSLPEARIIRVSRGEVLRVASRAQIGDPAAVELFLQAEKDQPRIDLPPQDDQWLQDRLDAGAVSSVMSRVVHSATGLTSIGETEIDATVSKDRAFRYRAAAMSILTQDVEVGAIDSEQKNAARRSIDGGQFRISCCPATLPGVGAVALHLVDQRLSVFSYPMALGSEGVVYRGLDANQMADRVQAEYGVGIDVSFAQPSP